MSSAIRRLRVALGSPSLLVKSTACATKSWKAKLVDLKGNVAHVTTAADVRCPRGASR